MEYAAASDHEGEVLFHIDPNNPLGGGAAASASDTHQAVLPSVPIDAAVARRSLAGPFLLKLDTQGHEYEVLSGATETLRRTSLVVIEVYAIDEPGRPAFDQVCAHMKTLGFKAAGIADILNRPCDGAWWQADMFFLRSDHPCFQDTWYH